MKGRPPPVRPNDVRPLMKMIPASAAGAPGKGHFALARPRELIGEGMGHHTPVGAIRSTDRVSQMVSGRAKRPASYGAGYERARRTAPGKMMSNVQPASRGQPRSPSEVVERV